jgi:chromosomal replication initiation ATPase DnaA
MKKEQILAIIKAQNGVIRRLYKLLEEKPVELAKNKPVKLKEFICPAEQIIDATNKVFDTDCRIRRRLKNVVLARHCAAYLMSIYTTQSLSEIASQFSVTCHTTAYNSINTCQDIIETDEEYAKKVNEVRKILEFKFK